MYKNNNDSSSVYKIIISILILLLTVLGVSYFHHYMKTKELLFETIQGKKLGYLPTPQDLNSSFYINKRTSVGATLNKNYSSKFSHKQIKKPRSVQRRQNNGQKINEATCKFWSEQYRADHSEYNRLMQKDACKRVGYIIQHRSQISSAPIINNDSNIQNKKAYITNSCASKRSCSNFKMRLEHIINKMRRGYKASDYNRLETKRRYWKKKIYDGCDCYPTNSF